jgi:antitoxin (DNA-binding transcriptional repressor) of toxin-antitoxin stability system
MNDHPRVTPRIGHVTVESLGVEGVRLMQRVLNGETVEIQKDGATIAVLTAAPEVDAATRQAVEAAAREARAKAWEAHKAELMSRPILNRGKFDREELYDDALKNRGR